jgi:hypothetical protein
MLGCGLGLGPANRGSFAAKVAWSAVTFALLLVCPAGAQKKPAKKPATTLLPASPAPPWSPPDIDSAVPPVDTNVPCSLADVIASASAKVKELVTNLERFTATEKIQDARLAKGGKWTPTGTYTFRYLAFISEIRPGRLSVEERRDRVGSSGISAPAIDSTGLAAFALVFHPYYTGDFQMVCEGRADWQGRPAWQVHFAQRPDIPARFQDFVVPPKRVVVRHKGRAWIDAETYQVLHMDVDLTAPISEIRLKAQHLSIDYRPVQFQQRNLQLWLPGNVDMYVDLRSRRYHLRHDFSNYLLFSVDTSQDIPDKPPKQ